MTNDYEDMIARMRIEDPLLGEAHDRGKARAAIAGPIVEARRARGWTQRDLAAASGVAQPVIARFEVGDTDPKITTLNKLAGALGLRIAIVPEPDAG